MNERDFSKCIKFKEVEQPTQTVVINGVPQEIKSKVLVAHCPKCDRVILNFGNIPEVEAIKLCVEHYEEILKQTTYCPCCGQKLDYPNLIVDISEQNDIIKEEEPMKEENKDGNQSN